MGARFALGLGEAGNFPGAIKTVAEWFPRKERAFATGIFNAGTNIGALLTPLIVPVITLSLGWEWAFIATGALGFLWLALWWVSYRSPEEHPRVSQAELAYIRSDPPEPTTKMSWGTILPHRQAWTFAVAKFMTDPVWWLYLFWIPDFLYRNYGLSLTTMGPPIVVIYLIGDVGSVGGGWLSSTLIKRGWTVNAARKTAMLVCALAVTPIVFAAQRANLWVAVGLDWPGGGGAPGLVCQRLHADVRHVPEAGDRLGRRVRRHGRRDRRNADREGDGGGAAVHRQLSAGVHHRGVGVPAWRC